MAAQSTLWMAALIRYGAAAMNAPPSKIGTADLQLQIIPEGAAHAAAVMALVERAFGPGRYAKVSERLREGNRVRADLSFVAVAAGQVVGTIRQWPVKIGETHGVFLGPIAVEGAWRKHRIGGDLIARAVAAGEQAGEAFVLLVGDMPLFGPYGFEIVPKGRVILPHSTVHDRTLWRALRAGGLDGVAGRAHVPVHERDQTRS
jgi:predicted N-acetyltransferase YhbS